MPREFSARRSLVLEEKCGQAEGTQALLPASIWRRRGSFIERTGASAEPSGSERLGSLLLRSHTFTLSTHTDTRTRTRHKHRYTTHLSCVRPGGWEAA